MTRSTLCAAALLVLLAACQSQPPVRLMPPPSVFVKADASLFAAQAGSAAATGTATGMPTATSDPHSTDIQLFYATNRKGEGPLDDRHYARTPTDDLHLGVAELAIGDGTLDWDALHALSTQASDGAPRPEIRLRTLREDALVDTRQGDPVGGAAGLGWLRQIDAALAGSADPAITIYVHGANTGMQRAMAQAAQYQHFTGRNSVVLSYVWPSAENHWRFSRDVANTGTSAPTFAHLLRMLSMHTRAARINIIAYSSGSMVAAGALALLDTPDARFPANTLRMGEVYYAAPDADFRTFVAQLQRYKGIGPRVTVSANMGDRVLLFSRIHQGASRAGRPRMGELGDDATQWLLDAAAHGDLDLLQVKPEVMPGLSATSHAFWYDHPWVSSDLLLKMLYGLAPQQRGLQEATSGNGVAYWEFPADYPQRLRAVMDTLPALVPPIPKNAPVAPTAPAR